MNASHNSCLDLWIRTGKVTAIEASNILRVCRPHRWLYYSYPCLVSLSLHKAWIQVSLVLLTEDRKTIRDSLASWIDQSSWWQIQKSEGLTLFSSGLGDRDDGVIFLGQCQRKVKKRKEGFMLKYKVLIWCPGKNVGHFSS